MSFYSAILCTSCVYTYAHISFSIPHPSSARNLATEFHFTQTINKSQHCSNILPELILITSLPLFYLLLPPESDFQSSSKSFLNCSLLIETYPDSLLENCFPLYSQLSKPPYLGLSLCVCVCVLLYLSICKILSYWISDSS